MSDESTITVTAATYSALYGIALNVAVAHPCKDSLQPMVGEGFAERVASSMPGYHVLVVPAEHLGAVLVALQGASDGK